MPELVGQAARRSIVDAHREFRRRARRALAGRRDSDLHGLRIAAKRLRYTIEFFASVLGSDRSTALGLLVLLQDKLGAIADAAAFRRFYDSLAGRIDKGDPRMPGVRALMLASDERHREAIAAVLELWRGAQHPPYPDMLAASISSALSSAPPNDG